MALDAPGRPWSEHLDGRRAALAVRGGPTATRRGHRIVGAIRGISSGGVQLPAVVIESDPGDFGVNPPTARSPGFPNQGESEANANGYPDLRTPNAAAEVSPLVQVGKTKEQPCKHRRGISWLIAAPVRSRGLPPSWNRMIAPGRMWASTGSRPPLVDPTGGRSGRVISQGRRITNRRAAAAALERKRHRRSGSGG